MSIKVEMTGSGQIGEITPGWSVNEFATPIIPGDTAGGTGGVSFGAGARDNSLFVVNNRITTTEETLGSVSGTVNSVSETGISLSLTHNTAISLFDANFKIPALNAGGLYPAIDLASQLIKRDILLVGGTGVFYCLCGHSAGFDEKGNLVDATYRTGTYSKSGGSFNYDVTYVEQVGKIWGTGFEVLNNEIIATSVLGDSFPCETSRTSARIAFKTYLAAGQSTVFAFTGGPTANAQSVNVSVNYDTNNVVISGTSPAGSFSNTASLSALDLTKELAVFIEYVRPSNITSGQYTVKATVCNTSNYSVTATATVSYTTNITIFNNPWTLNGRVRAVWRAQDKGIPTADFVKEYEGTYSFTVAHDVQVYPPVPAVEMNLWEYIQAACSAYGHEIALVNDELIVRDIDTNVVSIDKVVGSPTISPSIILSGTNVDIVYSNSVSVVDQELYNAYDDGNRVISVKTDETITTTVTVNGTPAVINMPTRDTVAPNDVGTYCITYSTGMQVPVGLFERWGGNLLVSISDTVENAIDITLSGPSQELADAGYPGPYSLSYQAAGTNYAALSITGSGIITDNKTLRLQTAADPNKVKQEVSTTVTNPFICTLEQAYDRGLLTSINSAGPKVVLSGTIPVSSISGFGLVAGSRIYYRDSIYRIVDANIGNLGVSFTAVRHVTVNDFDSLWAGKTVGMHDATWDGLETQDQIIAPLTYIGDNETVVMLIDVDGLPYYALSGEAEISIFTDTDGNPYLIEGGGADGSIPVYLDEDINPYFGGA